MYHRVYSFLQLTGQIYSNQYGFRANHSCEQAVGQVIGTSCQGPGEPSVCRMCTAGPFQGL